MDREAAIRRGLRLEYLTLGWNALEAAIAIISGIIAGSIALMGFGLDSIIELSSAAVLLWRLNSDVDSSRRERAEQTAQRLVAISFLALTVYVIAESIRTLVRRHAPEASWPGIAIAAAALIVMPLLARAKRAVAQSLGSPAMHADSRQSDICAYLSGITVAGLLLNAMFGWWWADPAAALLMSPLIAKEGVEAWQGRMCAADGCLSR